MGNNDRQELEQLRKINKALIDRAGQAIDPQVGTYEHVRADTMLEEQVRKRTSSSAAAPLPSWNSPT